MREGEEIGREDRLGREETGEGGGRLGREGGREEIGRLT